ncbi:AraC family transcriptional regulator [Marinifilum breve]|uniref:AraC family transcriptional regulator n=1 Tax=Marinifilum breve TaxID=2184082 RepID=A0A2V3ZZS6_9BACT|nr:helix-turn-helix domain-containing protein [Marinifilum breve]PXY01992.1 AraC family transcriptional regulator [Marinifilum breve]
MQLFKTISEYCNAIGIKPPKHPHFDIRRFEENKEYIRTKMLPFRHEFYFIAIRTYGEGKVKSGHHTQFPEGVTIYFNTPFQIQSWEIDQEWSGYYLIFSQDFLSSSHYFDRVLDDFPFLKIDASLPFKIDQKDLPELVSTYDKIKQEYISDDEDKFNFIEIYVLELLNQIKRLFKKHHSAKTVQEQILKADLKLLSRFENLVKASFCCATKVELISNPHSPSDYANELNVHPNHLNAVVKSITGQTALNHIHNHILQLAKADLAQTNTSSKEIAYKLHFSSPAKFSAFFKKHTDLSPLSYRKNANL